MGWNSGILCQSNLRIPTKKFLQQVDEITPSAVLKSNVSTIVPHSESITKNKNFLAYRLFLIKSWYNFKQK